MAWLSHFLEMTLYSNPVISTEETAYLRGFFVAKKQKSSTGSSNCRESLDIS